MICPYPILVKDKFGFVRRVACGQCSACRLNKAREWSVRIMNESGYYKDNCFLTLTYDDDHLPVDLSVSRRELQLFLKRLRKKTEKIRYFASGEYGDKNHRPHYHLVLFGLSPSSSLFRDKKYSKKAKGCWCRLDQWPQGEAFVGDVTYDSACYVAKYTMKKVRGKKGKEHYDNLGIQPEFVLMSLKPGIGQKYLRDNFNRLKKREYVVGKNGIQYGLPRYYKDRLFEPGSRALKTEIDVRNRTEEEKQRAKSLGKSFYTYREEILKNAENIVKAFIKNKEKENAL